MVTKMFVVVVLALVLATSTAAITIEKNELLAQKGTARAQMTCDIFPRVCRVAGSAGPDCCRKQCVNVATDGNNCGRCGRRCKFGEVCCGGSCVNVLYDPRNCGWCKNKCKKGSKCNYGMCNYA